MIATIIIAAVLFAYAGIMTIKSVKNIKRSLKGEGCSDCAFECTSDCSECNVVTDFDFK